MQDASSRQAQRNTRSEEPLPVCRDERAAIIPLPSLRYSTSHKLSRPNCLPLKPGGRAQVLNCYAPPSRIGPITIFLCRFLTGRKWSAWHLPSCRPRRQRVTAALQPTPLLALDKDDDVRRPFCSEKRRKLCSIYAPNVCTVASTVFLGSGCGRCFSLTDSIGTADIVPLGVPRFSILSPSSPPIHSAVPRSRS